MLKIDTENGHSFEYESSDGKITLNDNAFDWDLIQTSEGSFHIIKNNKSYNAEVLAFDRDEKKITLLVNKSKVELTVKDRFDLLLEKMGMADLNANQLENIKAPMPGLILDITVSEGDEVKKGDQLLVLEAMKMENIIKSPGDGTITAIKVKKGDAVEKNQIVIEF